jgi:hypothetical protein
MGPLRVHPRNPRYFADGGGRAVYLTGSHTWSNLQDQGPKDPPRPFDYEAYLDFLRERNHNVIRLRAWEQARWAPRSDGKGQNPSDWFIQPNPYARTGPGRALDGKPKFDLERWDDAYFERLRTRVRLARERGIYVSVMRFQGWSSAKSWLGGTPWRGHPYHPENNVQGFNGNRSGDTGPALDDPRVRERQAAYIREVVDTLNDLDNVLYEVTNGARAGEATAGTVLGIRDTRFTLDSRPTFLLGISYYGALGAPEEFIRRDLDDLARHGFNWVRVWATWGAFDRDVSAVDAEGRAREPFLGRLGRLVAECDRRGLVVDVTLTRGDRANGGAIPDLKAHRRAVETLVGALKEHRNWYLDLANERDVRDARHVPAGELRALREQVRVLDPERLVTASFGGHDLDEADLREALLTIGLDFVAPHRPREAGSAGQTEARTRECLATMRRIGRSAPVHYQEPFRRGYGRWQPTASDFLTDLRGAVAGGAAGWCLHNGSSRGDPE